MRLVCIYRATAIFFPFVLNSTMESLIDKQHSGRIQRKIAQTTTFIHALHYLSAYNRTQRNILTFCGRSVKFVTTNEKNDHGSFNTRNRDCKTKEIPTDTAVRQTTFTHVDDRSRSTTKTMFFRKTHAGLFFSPLLNQMLRSVVFKQKSNNRGKQRQCLSTVDVVAFTFRTISAVNHIYGQNKINRKCWLQFHSQDRQLITLTK